MRAFSLVVLAALAVACQASVLVDPHIVGGQEAAPHQFPYQVGILNQWITGQVIFCGGSLIHPSWVLTAAHCVKPGMAFQVTAGAHWINEKEATQQVILSKEGIVHEGWRGGRDGEVSPLSLANDIALIHLPRPFELQEGVVETVRLPSEKQKKDSFYRREVYLSGWGKTSNDAPAKSPVLQFTTTKVVSNFYCKARYLFLLPSDTNICASGEGGHSSCHGDSGGPMVTYEADGKPTLLGITSFGFGNFCDWGWPAVYTRVTSYLDWIKEKTNGDVQ